MIRFLFNLQNHAEEGEGQAIAPEDFGKLSAAEQGDILGKMVKGEPIGKQPPVDQEDNEEEIPEVKPEPVKRKIKVNGEEIELTDEELIAHAQKGMSADKKFEEASKLRKEAKAEREALEAEKQQKQSESNKGRLAQSAQEVKNFAIEFEKAFGEEFNQFDINHIDIFTQFKMQQLLSNQDTQRNKAIIESAYDWAEKNPNELEKLDDAIYALANEPSSRKQMRSLLTARGRFDDGNATVHDLQFLEEFRTKITITKPLPKEVIAEKKKVQQSEKAGSELDKKQEQGIDWERAKTDVDYQTRVLAGLTRKK